MHIPISQLSAYEPRADRVLSVYQAAEVMGVSASTLKRRARAGDIKILKLSPRRVGVKMSEVQRFLDACAA